MSSIARVGLIVALSLCFSACQKAELPPAASGGDAAPVSAAMPVRAGMKTLLFEARTSREIRAAAGTTFVLGPLGEGERVTTVIAQRANGGIDLNCGCPAGCSGGDGGDGLSLGCSVTMDNDNPTEAICGGDCSSPNASCMGCSFAFTPPAPDDPRAEWVRDLTANPGSGAGVDAGTPPTPPGTR